MVGIQTCLDNIDLVHKVAPKLSITHQHEQWSGVKGMGRLQLTKFPVTWINVSRLAQVSQSTISCILMVCIDMTRPRLGLWSLGFACYEQIICGEQDARVISCCVCQLVPRLGLAVLQVMQHNWLVSEGSNVVEVSMGVLCQVA